MEENNVIKEPVKNGSYLTGIIGAILGGSIAAIPWVLMYVYGNMILSALAIIIALGALKGYQLARGKITKVMKPIIILISILVVVVATLVVIPNLMAIKDDLDLNYLYNSDKFTGALMQDLTVSVIFTILGVSVAISYINKVLMDNGVIKEDPEIAKKKEELLKAQVDNKLKGKNKEDIEKMRTTFSTLDAFTRETAAEKEKIIEELNSPEAEKLFKKFKNRNIIQKYNDKYFYDKSKEILLTNNYLVTVFVIVIIVIGIFAGLMYTDVPDNNDTILSKMASQEICYRQISIDVPEDFKKEVIDYEESVLFYNDEGDVSIRVNCISKEFLGEYKLTDYKVDMEEHLKDSYSLEKEVKLKEGKVGNYNSYACEFDTTYNGSRLHANTYVIELDNYFVEVYTFSLRSKQDDYKDMFNNVVNSIKEVK